MADLKFQSNLRSLLPFESQLFKIDEAYPFTGEGRSKFYEALNAGKIKSVKKGKSRLIPGSEILRYNAEIASRAK